MQIQDLILEIDEDNYEDFLENELSLLHFFSDWKMNCLMSFPMIEALAEEFSDKIHFGKVNVEEFEEIAEKYEVKRVPCVIIFRRGEQIERIENCDSEEVLRKKICCLF